MQDQNETNVASRFAESLSAGIKRSGLSRHAFAAEVGLSHTALGNYLSGRLPKIEEAMRIARFLGVGLDDMLTGHDPGKVPRPGSVSDQEQAPYGGGEVWRERALRAEQALRAIKAAIDNSGVSF